MDQPSAPRHPGRPRQRIAIRTVLPALLAAGALAACASAPQPAPFIAAGTASIEAARASGAAELAPVPLDNARAKLQQAQALAQAGNHEDAVRLAQQADVDAQLARARAGAERSRRSAAEKRAQQALRAAEQAATRQRDAALARHHAYLATQHAEIALAMGAQAQSEAQMQQASLDRERVQLEARTREADLTARSAQGDALASRYDAEMARRQAALQAERAGALERDLQALQAQNTQRGMVVTLSDVLFDTGKARLQPGAQRSVAQLATVLKQYPERRVLIEGFTDNVGPEDLNLELSRRRAEAFQRALQSAGVPQVRMETQARGEADPVANNATPAGRQQNRRVEVLFSDEQGQFAAPSQELQSPPSQSR